MNKENYTVYMHVTPSNKVYIGMTGKELSVRFQNGFGYRTSTIFRKAIMKHGWNNISHYVLFENLSKKEAELREIQMIKYYNSNDRKFGYNTATGGRVNSGYKLTNEHIEKLRKAKEGRYLGADNPVAKPIICITTGDRFVTAKDASDKMQCCRENIVSCCHGRLKSAGKHPVYGFKLQWKYDATENNLEGGTE